MLTTTYIYSCEFCIICFNHKLHVFYLLNLLFLNTYSSLKLWLSHNSISSFKEIVNILYIIYYTQLKDYIIIDFCIYFWYNIYIVTKIFCFSPNGQKGEEVWKSTSIMLFLSSDVLFTGHKLSGWTGYMTDFTW